ncbi:hypothetical protein EBR21_16675 [bacterium]|nr:hypothetical protein [bacterium]
MKMVNGDVIFLGNGRPAVVKNVDYGAGTVELENDLAKIQKQAEGGIKNNLDEKQRAAYNVSLKNIESDSKKEEIQNLYDMIQSYKETKRVDPKVMRYLENELMHRMLRDEYTPPNYQTDLRNLAQT